ncbi:MAG TPA: nuclear transport factor 2 family protein [Chitinophagaceae bacterium]|jgi:ketosteroid isomerase-like protein|nr:nuclear transport factor 2 family protein [Chitinophagaceae bacterium]
MKKILISILLLSVITANAQSKNEKALVERTYLLSRTVFGTKDSLTLEDLFAKPATYGHSHGNIQTREQAINGIYHNQSTYTDTTVSNMSVIFADDDMAIVRHVFKAKETAKDGKVTPLNLGLMLVWVKEKGKWKLFGRQAVPLQ